MMVGAACAEAAESTPYSDYGSRYLLHRSLPFPSSQKQVGSGPIDKWVVQGPLLALLPPCANGATSEGEHACTS